MALWRKDRDRDMSFVSNRASAQDEELLDAYSSAVVGVVEAARQQNLEIPGDLALVCFDDIEHVSRLYPFLTVMAQPAETFGTIATQLLLDRLSGRVDQRRRIVVLPADFMVRKSSGALAREHAETP